MKRLVSFSFLVASLLGGPVVAQEASLEAEAARKDSIFLAKTKILNRQFREALQAAKIPFTVETADKESSKERTIITYTAQDGSKMQFLAAFRVVEVEPSEEKPKKKKDKKDKKDKEDKQAKEQNGGQEGENEGIVLEFGVKLYESAQKDVVSKLKPVVALLPAPKVKLPGVKTRKPELIETPTDVKVMMRFDLAPMNIKPEVLAQVLEIVTITAAIAEKQIKEKLAK